MGEWKETTLGDLCSDVLTGGTPLSKKLEYYNGGTIPWLKTKEVNFNRIISTEYHISELGLKNSSAKLVPANSVIVAMYGQGATAGRVAINKVPLTTNQACCNLVIDKKIADYEFIYYYLSNSYEELVLRKTGSAQPNLNTKLIRGFPINHPPLPEQQAIASILSSLDEKIDLLHRQNKTLEGMAEALFRQWFVEEAKEDWEGGVLGDEFEFTMGQSPLGSTFNENGEGTPMYQGNRDFEFRFPTKRVYTTAPKRFALKHDTLISVRAPVGAQNMANEKCCIGRGVAAFRYKENPSYYTYTYFKMRNLMSEIKKFNDEGTVFGSIGKGDFEKLDILIPSSEAIEKFQNEVKPIDDKVILNCNQIKNLENIRDTLLPKLMNGTIKIKTNG